jgi:hypothetical protein
LPLQWHMVCGAKSNLVQDSNSVRIAQQALHVKHCPMEGIDMDMLQKSSPIYIESYAPTPFQTPALPPQQPNEPESEPEQDDNMAPKTRSIDTAKGWCRPPPHQPHRTGDDPFRLEDMLDEPKESQGRRLEEIPPDKYEGNRGKMIAFLTQFKQYILTN